MLLVFEDSVEMDHVNDFMQRELNKWRRKVKNAASLKDIATSMRELRACMRDEHAGRRLFRSGQVKGSQQYDEWRKAASKPDITFDTLHALLTQLKQSYVVFDARAVVPIPQHLPEKKQSPEKKPKTEKATIQFVRGGPSMPRAIDDRRTFDDVAFRGLAADGVAAPSEASPKRSSEGHLRTEPQGSDPAPSAVGGAKARPPQVVISLESDDESAEVSASKGPASANKIAAAPKESESIKTLMEMGFSEGQCSAALKASGGDAEQAANALLVAGDLSPSAGQLGGRKRLVKGAPSGVPAARRSPIDVGASSSSAERPLQVAVQNVANWKEAKPWTLAEAQQLQGAKLEIWWAGNRCWFAGKVVDVNKETCAVYVKYTDGEWKWHKMWQEAFRNIRLKLPKAAAEPSRPAVKAPKAEQPGQMPTAETKRKAPSQSAAAPKKVTKPAPAPKSAPRPAPRSAPRPAPKLPAQPAAGAPQPGAGLASSSTHQSTARPASEPPAAAGGDAARGQADDQGQPDPKPIGRETQPARYLEINGQCTCTSSADDDPCADKRCTKYTYYDAMRMVAKYGDNQKTGLISFSEGSCMLCKDPGEGPDLVAEMGGVRKHKEHGRVECLARWFCRANDPMIDAALGDAPRPPNLVYRLSLGDDSQERWLSDWTVAKSVLSKCRSSYAPPAQIMQLCDRAAKKGLTDQLFYDSYMILHDNGGFVPPQKLPQSKRVQEATAGEQPTAAQIAAAESSDEEEQQPLSARRDARGLGKRGPRARATGAEHHAGPAQDKRYRIAKRSKGAAEQRSIAPRRSSKSAVERIALDDLPDGTNLPRSIAPGAVGAAPICVGLPETTAEEEARQSACDFVHLVRPQAGDAFAGGFYELGLAGRRPSEKPDLPPEETALLARIPSPAGATAPAPFAAKVPWGVASVPRGLREPLGMVRPKQPFGNGDEFRPYPGRFFPILLTRVGPEGRMKYLTGVEPPLMCPKVERALREGSGKGRPAHIVLKRGVALEPSRGVAGPSFAAPHKGDEDLADLRELEDAMKKSGTITPEIDAMRRRLWSDVRHVLNGTMLNRFKYTSFSRHFTSERVLNTIAGALQPHLKPGDTFVDFACGLNTFAPMLKDPASGRPLNSVAFDLFSPVCGTDGFTRSNWLQVDAQRDLPPGELIIGLNPPFGHQNRIAIEFVEHALCARPRMLVLIMPSTNYEPAGYELIEKDEQLCRGNVFYTPGSGIMNINAHNVKPNFLMYRRKDEVAPPRQCHCCHRVAQLKAIRRYEEGKRMAEAKLKRKADARARQLLGIANADAWPTAETDGPSWAAAPSHRESDAPYPASLPRSLHPSALGAGASCGGPTLAQASCAAALSTRGAPGAGAACGGPTFAQASCAAALGAGRSSHDPRIKQARRDTDGAGEAPAKRQAR